MKKNLQSKVKSQKSVVAPRALFIGRFQPFHFGHLKAIKEILKKEKFLIIAIGSAQYYEKPDNPFTASERYEMIKSALQEEKINPGSYAIIPVWNIENNKKWIEHVNRILPVYRNIYTGSGKTKKLYEEHYKIHKKHPIKNIRLYEISGEFISATLIREKMTKGKKWQKYVPKSVEKLLKQWIP